VAFWVELQPPLTQAMHARSAVALAWTLITSPATQFRQVAHRLAFAAALKVPAVQASQVRSAVALPANATA
jgi:hypothetical protein